MATKYNEADLLDHIALLEKQLSIAEADVRFWRAECNDRDNMIQELDRALDEGGCFPDDDA